MRYLNFLKPQEKSKIPEVTTKANTFNVKSALDQIVEYLGKIPLSAINQDYKLILDEIKNHLKYKEVELLLQLIVDLPMKENFLSRLEKEKHYWHGEIDDEYKKHLEHAELSLCTSDYLAFIIGTKYDLYVLINNNSFWSEIYTDIDHKLSLIILQNNLLCKLEGNQKAHVPVNYALSMFLIYDKKVALPKFKRILHNDRIYRLEPLHQAEYFLAVDKFFKRLKLPFIPKILSNFTGLSDENKTQEEIITYLNYFNSIIFSTENAQYVTKEAIEAIIDKEDYFNQRNFLIEKKYLLPHMQIEQEERIKKLYFAFFNFFCPNKISKHQIDILFSCFTEVNPKYEELEIKTVRNYFSMLIKDKNLTKELAYMSYYLVTNILDNSREKIKFLTSTFFKTKGISISTLSDIFSDRKDKDKSYNTELPPQLVAEFELIQSS
jgi:hypothetical protein